MKKIIAIIVAALMLTSVIMIAASAETADAWETLAYKHGFNVYVGAPTDTPPVIDGVIEDGEYSHPMYTSVKDILPLDDRTPAVNGGAAEYFAYDAEYVYYAAKFQQREDGRSFWLQWKAENRFDIFYH